MINPSTGLEADIVNATIMPFLDLARLQPGLSVLDLGCGSCEVAVRVKIFLGGSHGLIVGILESHDTMQQARCSLKTFGYANAITLYHGDPIHLNNIPGFDRTSSDSNRPFFDVIFARNLLSNVSPFEREEVLRHWANYKAPGSGRLMVSMSMEVHGSFEIARSVIVDEDGGITSRYHCMIESEWEHGEEAFRTLALSAGLHLSQVQRVGFSAEDSEQWEEIGADLDDMLSLSTQSFEDRGGYDLMSQMQMEVSQGYSKQTSGNRLCRKCGIGWKSRRGWTGWDCV
ncbi:hypothetical protein HO173_003188 [Letharia columbiana]|uniref:Methyltransferase domain-containing protein n=1 Tax=Letharia columbiana TaxID=112416 RepID=A0A8H6G1F6_9LECA|nr:uncharacterized protein HO173_003188 [Letharia columbiana]KAF6238682.1 hypothetical protein HO173_003188 [Letharia columbiana]